MGNRQHEDTRRRIRKIDIALYATTIGYPFLYGYNVLAFAKPITAPTEAYIYLIKPTQFLLTLGFYLYAVYYANRRVQGWSQAGRAVAFVSSSIFAISILIFSFTDIYKQLGVVGPDGELHKEPGICLYFSVATWTTLGYGDFRPATNAGRLFAGIEAMLGYIVMGVFIAAMANLLFVLQGSSPTTLSKAQVSSARASKGDTTGESPNPEPQAEA